MLRNNLSRSIFSSLTLTGLFISLAVTTSGQGASNKLPRGDWTFSAGVYSGPGHESAPVDVFSVTSDAARGLAVTQVELLNRTDREVRALKLHWYLKTEGRVLQEGDTPLIDVDLPAGGKQTLAYPVVSFARLATSLGKNGVLTGDYRVEVLVGEVEYASASGRKRAGR